MACSLVFPVCDVMEHLCLPPTIHRVHFLASAWRRDETSY